MLETMKPSYMVTRVPAGTFLNYVRSILTSSAKHDPRIMVSSSTWSMTREIVFLFPTLRHVHFRIRCRESIYGSNYFYTFLVIVVSSFFCFFFIYFFSVFCLGTYQLYCIFYSVHFIDWIFFTSSILIGVLYRIDFINYRLIEYVLHRQLHKLPNWIFSAPSI